MSLVSAAAWSSSEESSTYARPLGRPLAPFIRWTPPCGTGVGARNAWMSSVSRDLKASVLRDLRHGRRSEERVDVLNRHVPRQPAHLDDRVPLSEAPLRLRGAERM